MRAQENGAKLSQIDGIRIQVFLGDEKVINFCLRNMYPNYQ